MKSSNYMSVVMMGLALLVFAFDKADAGMTEKSIKQDEMKKNTWHSKVCRSKL